LNWNALASTKESNLFGDNIPDEPKYFKASTLVGYCTQLIHLVSKLKYTSH